MSRFDLVAFGDVAVDLYFRVDTVPAPGEKVAAVFAGSFAGGMGGNVAAAAATAGLDCSVVARVGCDHWGTKLVHELAARKISVDWIVRDPEPTSQTVIQLLPDGERSILVGVPDDPTLEYWERALSETPRLVYLAPSALANSVQLAKIAKDRSVLVAVDIERHAFERNQDILGELLAYCDLVVVNSSVALRLPRRRSGEVRVELRGADGLAVEADSGSWGGGPADNVHVVDTTGAGDAAAGAACAALLAGLDVDGIGIAALRASLECVVRLGARGPLT